MFVLFPPHLPPLLTALLPPFLPFQGPDSSRGRAALPGKCQEISNVWCWSSPGQGLRGCWHYAGCVRVRPAGLQGQVRTWVEPCACSVCVNVWVDVCVCVCVSCVYCGFLTHTIPMCVKLNVYMEQSFAHMTMPLSPTLSHIKDISNFLTTSKLKQ